ncbi:hypothetical protein [Mucilaginibacter sp. dw_454]|uniref:hypothetical protein n=1 Tax=Mucilaginibacter sp. dw_454 TaxID=2720079 RepID=UPI001BD3C834|nr:hypothetical protein [Mucilaginibacter sp. dw_454]
MDQTIIIPTREGQICKISNPMTDENPEDIYIVSEDPTLYDDDASIYITNIKDLQRNIHAPQFAPQVPVIKTDLTVIAENIGEYIASWNR